MSTSIEDPSSPDAEHPSDMGRVAVIGAGSWGTALAISLATTGHSVRMWARRDVSAQYMQAARRNPTYLPGIHITDTIDISADLEWVVDTADFWVIATPSHAVRSVAERLSTFTRDDLVVVSVAKGIENDTLLTTSQVLSRTLVDLPKSNIAVLYGPSHAEEVATNVPTAVVVASHNLETARKVQGLFMSERLRVYINRDLIGVEISGSVKNVMALAAGMADGIGYGDNAKAALLTRGMAEIRRLGMAMGADPTTFSGLAGIGDLVVTCNSRHSRNRYVGEQIGKGRTLHQVQSEMDMVAEGVLTTRSTRALARKYNVEMPITEAVYGILFENKKPREAVYELMTRSPKHEDQFPDSLDGEPD
ncbi:MAG: NAD(P)H-dependent glycerol-3-phosphate dehydrogenase [Rhodothermales bacterium]